MEEKLQNLTMTKALIIGIVIMGAYWGVLYDDGSKLDGQIKGVKAQIRTKEKQVAEAKKAVQDAARYKDLAVQLGAQMERIVQAIPEKLSIFDLMKLLSTEAKIAGANILSVVPGSSNNQRRQRRRRNDPEEDNKFFEEILVSVTLECTFTQMMTYLSNLTKVDKIITLKTLDLGSGSGRDKPVSDDGAPILKMRADIAGYRYLGAKADQ